MIKKCTCTTYMFPQTLKTGRLVSMNLSEFTISSKYICTCK